MDDYESWFCIRQFELVSTYFGGSLVDLVLVELTMEHCYLFMVRLPAWMQAKEN